MIYFFPQPKSLANKYVTVSKSQMILFWFLSLWHELLSTKTKVGEGQWRKFNTLSTLIVGMDALPNLSVSEVTMGTWGFAPYMLWATWCMLNTSLHYAKNWVFLWPPLRHLPWSGLLWWLPGTRVAPPPSFWENNPPFPSRPHRHHHTPVPRNRTVKGKRMRVSRNPQESPLLLWGWHNCQCLAFHSGFWGLKLKFKFTYRIKSTHRSCVSILLWPILFLVSLLQRAFIFCNLVSCLKSFWHHK